MALQPQILQIHVDFVKALQNAAIQSFNPQRIRGCYFHYTQFIWRKVQKLGLAACYEDEVIDTCVRRAPGFPFLPLNLVDKVRMEVVSTMNKNDVNAVQFINYITTTFAEEYVAAFQRKIWT